MIEQNTAFLLRILVFPSTIPSFPRFFILPYWHLFFCSSILLDQLFPPPINSQYNYSNSNTIFLLSFSWFSTSFLKFPCVFLWKNVFLGNSVCILFSFFSKIHSLFYILSSFLPQTHSFSSSPLCFRESMKLLKEQSVQLYKCGFLMNIFLILCMFVSLMLFFSKDTRNVRIAEYLYSPLPLSS